MYNRPRHHCCNFVLRIIRHKFPACKTSRLAVLIYTRSLSGLWSGFNSSGALKWTILFLKLNCTQRAHMTWHSFKLLASFFITPLLVHHLFTTVKASWFYTLYICKFLPSKTCYKQLKGVKIPKGQIRWQNKTLHFLSKLVIVLVNLTGNLCCIYIVFYRCRSFKIKFNVWINHFTFF